MPIYQVTDPQSGKTIELTGDSPPTEQELEEVFTSVNAGSPGLSEGTQPQENGKFFQGNALQKGADVLSLGSYAIGGMLDRAQKEGAQAFNPLKNPFGIPAAIEGVKERKALMSEVPETFGIDPNSAEGIALGFGAELLTPDLGEVSGAYKAAGKVIGMSDLGGKITKATGKIAEDVGNFVGLKGIRPSAAELRDFKALTNIDLPTFARERGLYGKSADQVKKQVFKITDTYDNLVSESQNVVLKENLYDYFSSVADKMAESTDDAWKSKAKDVEKFMWNLLDSKKYADQEYLTAQNLLDEKREIGDLIKKWKPGAGDVDTLQSKYQILMGALNDIASDVVDPTSGKNIGELGKEIQKLLAYDKIISRTEELGKGNLPINLVTVLTSQLGTSITGAVSGATLGDSLENKIKGAAMGAGIGFVGNNPRVISAVANALHKSGEAIDSPAGKKIVSEMLDAIKEATVISSRNKKQGQEDSELTTIIDSVEQSGVLPSQAATQSARPGLDLQSNVETNVQPGFMYR